MGPHQPHRQGLGSGGGSAGRLLGRGRPQVHRAAAQEVLRPQRRREIPPVQEQVAHHHHCLRAVR